MNLEQLEQTGQDLARAGLLPFRAAIPEVAKRIGAGFEPLIFSHFHFKIEREGEVIWESAWIKNLTTDTASGYTNRRDWQAKAMGGGVAAAADWTAAATASSATTLTNSGAAWSTAGQGLAGMIVAVGPNASGAGSTVWGVIVSNTGTALTVDRWYSAATPGGTAGTTPNATGFYQILPGQCPAFALAVTADATAPTSADTTLATEATTNGFARTLATFAHTAAASTYTLVWVITATGSLTPAVAGAFGSMVSAKGAMPFKTAITSPPAMISGDVLTITEAVTIN